MKRLQRLVAAILTAAAAIVLFSPGVAVEAAGCGYGYGRSYSYSYPSYSYSYPSYSYSYPSYVYRDRYIYKPVYVPVAAYLDYAAYGNLYFGPSSAAAYDAAVKAAAKAEIASKTAVAASTTVTATTSRVSVTEQRLTTIQGDVRSVLSAVKDLSTVVGGIAKRLDSVEARVAGIDERLKRVEGRPPPARTEKEKAPKKKDEGEDDTSEGRGDAARPKLPDPLPIYVNHCAECHQAGKPVKGKLTLLDKEGKRAPLTGDQVAEMSGKLTAGTMPPPILMVNDGKGGKKPSHASRPLNERQTIALLLDLKNFPRAETEKKEKEDDEIRTGLRRLRFAAHRRREDG